jgi:hypothetical protein
VEDFVFEGVQVLRKKLDEHNFEYIYNEFFRRAYMG